MLGSWEEGRHQQQTPRRHSPDCVKQVKVGAKGRMCLWGAEMNREPSTEPVGLALIPAA